MSQFVTLHNGTYTINLEQISSIEWKGDKSKAIVKMRNGNPFKLMDEDYTMLHNLVLGQSR